MACLTLVATDFRLHRSFMSSCTLAFHTCHPLGVFMRLFLMITFVMLSMILSACGRWAPGYIITDDGTMLSNSDLNQRDVTVQTIRSALDKQLGEHWRTQVDLPELPIYESDERNSSLSWTWKKASVTVTLVGDGIVPLTISEKEIYDEIALFMHQKVFQVNKNLTIVITQKVDVTQLIALKKPIIPSKPDASLPRHYTIQTGDTWADLSQAFYGSTQHWRLLSDANQGGDLTVGRVLLIPIKP